MVLAAVLALEALAVIRAVGRMLATAGGTALEPAGPAPAGTIDAVVPVYNEETRLGPALRDLSRSGPSLGRIVVVDGGSTDGTAAVVAAACAHDARIEFLTAGPPPAGWNGKAWNLDRGLAATCAPWVATIDADVRAGAGVLDAAIARAERDGLVALSVATRQDLAGAGSALLHPALLTTLVYRGGLPNVASADPRKVAANGQLFVARRAALAASDAFRTARASRCEDVTVARILAAAGGKVGFYEGDAVVRMYESWRACAANWPRSLTLFDRFTGAARTWISLAELALAQALPLPTFLLLLALGGASRFGALAAGVAFALVAVRFGVLAGTRRAYVRPAPAYWLSPLADSLAVALLAASMLRRRHTWRGRTLVEETV
ncbi:MAG TPA: glycosyltransferase [Candidatus Elarobacter sp.]